MPKLVIFPLRLTGIALMGNGGLMMTDREKVIKGLECLAQKQAPTANSCKDCGYINRPSFAICVKDIASDALALLKEQQKLIDEITQRMANNGAFD